MLLLDGPSISTYDVETLLTMAASLCKQIRASDSMQQGMWPWQPGSGLQSRQGQ